MALHSAYSIGLHVRNEDTSAIAAKGEVLNHIWWSLYSLERTLSIMTRRPSIVVKFYCSVPSPMLVPADDISEEAVGTFRMQKESLTSKSRSPTFSISTNGNTDLSQTPVALGIAKTNSRSYFSAAVQLSIITQEIIALLYSADTTIRSPSDLQQHSVRLDQRLDQWVMSLPLELNFQALSRSNSLVFLRERMLLGFQLCSARILLTRPYLSVRWQYCSEENQAAVTRCMGSNCIEAAKTMVDFLPDVSDQHFIYDQGPWWCVVHHMIQAVSIFLLCLSYTSPKSQDRLVLLCYMKKVIRWLRTMHDPVTERAYTVALTTFDGVAKLLSEDISDLLIEDVMINAGRDAQYTGPDAGLEAYTQEHFVTIAPASTSTQDMSTIQPYNLAMNSWNFPSAE
jgi:hypothetical protein